MPTAATSTSMAHIGSIPQQDSLPSWFPFRTREDFEQVELFVLNHGSNHHIDRQLALI